MQSSVDKARQSPAKHRVCFESSRYLLASLVLPCMSVSLLTCPLARALPTKMSWPQRDYSFELVLAESENVAVVRVELRSILWITTTRVDLGRTMAPTTAMEAGRRQPNSAESAECPKSGSVGQKLDPHCHQLCRPGHACICTVSLRFRHLGQKNRRHMEARNLDGSEPAALSRAMHQ